MWIENQQQRSNCHGAALCHLHQQTDPLSVHHKFAVNCATVKGAVLYPKRKKNKPKNIPYPKGKQYPQNNKDKTHIHFDLRAVFFTSPLNGALNIGIFYRVPHQGQALNKPQKANSKVLHLITSADSDRILWKKNGSVTFAQFPSHKH